MSYSTPSSRQFPRASVYSSPATQALWRSHGSRAYGQDPGSDFTVGVLSPPPVAEGGAVAAAAAAVAAAAADACTSAGGTVDASGNCIPQADVPTPVQPSGGGGGQSVAILASPPPSVAPAKATLASTLTSGPMPWILGGLVVVGLLAVVSKKKSTSSSEYAR